METHYTPFTPLQDNGGYPTALTLLDENVYFYNNGENPRCKAELELMHMASEIRNKPNWYVCVCESEHSVVITFCHALLQ